ncbi:unnamed protein product [Prorocentrum cordatum]|uniref:Uncharacterized protein n=1 Tax=Prorocentrum cordatum TaxID=2364126 RepID=A0ABN9Q5U3_9DINO|nr:unnamed protein product [Polarella glacialis]
MLHGGVVARLWKQRCVRWWVDRERVSRLALQRLAAGDRVPGVMRLRQNTAWHARRVPPGGFTAASSAALSWVAAGHCLGRLVACGLSVTEPVRVTAMCESVGVDSELSAEGVVLDFSAAVRDEACVDKVSEEFAGSQVVQAPNADAEVQTDAVPTLCVTESMHGESEDVDVEVVACRVVSQAPLAGAQRGGKEGEGDGVSLFVPLAEGEQLPEQLADPEPLYDEYEDGAKIREGGFLQGYNRLVWGVILLQAVGGLVVAAVLKYADNLLKCFGNALSICISCMLSAVLLREFVPDKFFVFGTLLVMLATYVYSIGVPEFARLRWNRLFGDTLKTKVDALDA